MLNRKKLNKVIEEDFDQKNNYAKIINRIEDNNKYINFLKYCFIPLVTVMVLFIGCNYNNSNNLSGGINEAYMEKGTSNLTDSLNTGSNENKLTTDSKYQTYAIPSNKKDSLSYTTSKNCQKKKYYSKDITIYTYCIDSIKYFDNIELRDYLSNHDTKETIENIINKLNKEAVYKDGGSILYRESKPYKLSSEGVSVLKCNTLEGKKDIYIGPINMEYESDFCK